MMTQYEQLLLLAEKISDRYPRSYVVVDANTHAILAKGMDAKKVYKKVRQNLKPGQIPMVCKKPKKDEILIF
ncbi:hypothetical protein LLG95_18120 [bacterium]|nr:hypothetical protein [bacterium]